MARLDNKTHEVDYELRARLEVGRSLLEPIRPSLLVRTDFTADVVYIAPSVSVRPRRELLVSRRDGLSACNRCIS